MIRINEGTWDRALRVTVGAVLMYLGLGGVVTGVVGTALWIVGLVAMATGLVGWCAIYALLGIDTIGRKAGRHAIT